MKENLLLMSLQKNVAKNKSFDVVAEDFMREERLLWRSYKILSILPLESNKALQILAPVLSGIQLRPYKMLPKTLHVAIILIILDDINSKCVCPASIQPQIRPKSNFRWIFELGDSTQLLSGFQHSFQPS